MKNRSLLLLLIKSRKFWNKFIFFFIGIGSLIWFLIRVIPKPSRAMYPCQRAAFPVASGFVIWLTGTFVSFITFKKAREKYSGSKIYFSVILSVIAIISFVVSWFLIPAIESYSRPLRTEAEPVPEFIHQYTVSENFASPLAKVAIVKSKKEYAYQLKAEDIEELIKEAVEKDGVLDTLIKDGQTVVVKPNLVGNLEYSHGSKTLIPTNSINGIITNWMTIRAVVNIVRKYNPTGKVYVMEGSADGGTTRNIMAAYGYNNTNIPGVTDFIPLEETCGWQEWNSTKLSKVTLPENKRLYPSNLLPGDGNTFYLNKIYYEADVLISVPLLKNHSMTSVTGGVKNVGIGATPQRIYAGQSDNHRYYNNRIDHNNYTNLQKFIHDFYLCRPVDYVIMEGLEGTDYGPVASHPTSLDASKKNMRLILVGKDAVAVDAIASLIMGYNPMKINYLVYLNNDTSGCADPASIRVLGPDLNTLKKNFMHNESTGPKYYDFTPLSLDITSHSFKNNTLAFALNPVEGILKVEVLVNNEFLEKDIIAGFDSVHITTNQEITDETLIDIKVYDAFLNCTSFHYKGDIKLNMAKNLLLEKDLKIYPNPAKNEINIELDNSYSGSVNVEIIDLSGRIFKNMKYYKPSGLHNEKLDVSNIKTGNYLFKLTNSDGSLVYPINII